MDAQAEYVHELKAVAGYYGYTPGTIDVMLEDGSVWTILNVKRQLQYLGSAHGGYRYSTPKNNKPRIIVLPDKAVVALKQQRAKQNQMRLAAGLSWNNPDDLVFTNEFGEHLKHD